MPYFTNVSPQGDLDLPLLGRVIVAGETFEATPEQSALLEQQPDVWKLSKKPTTEKGDIE